MNYEMYSQAVEDLFALNAKPTLTTRDAQKQAALLAIVAAGKGKFTPEEIRRGERDRLLKASGLPRDPEHRHLGFLDESIEREYRAIGLGKARPTRVPDDRENRANQAGTESITYTQKVQGGAFVPIGMYGRVMESMKQYDMLFDEDFSNVIETDTGNGFDFPSIDDVGASAQQVTEATQSSENDVANFGSLQLNAWAFRTNLVGVSRELLQDSNFPIGAVLERALSIQLARGVGAALAMGTGVSSPTGLITGAIAAGANVVVASGSSANTGGAETGTNSVGTKDIGLLYQKLNPAYRPNAKFYMADDTLQYLNQLLDKNGRPIVDFAVGPTRDAAGPMIWGHPVAICPSFPLLGNAHNVAVFANPSWFIQRRVPSSCYLRVFHEFPSFIDKDMVGFQMWLRVDSGLVAPNSSFVPASVLQCHS